MTATVRIELTTGSVITAQLASAAEAPYIVPAIRDAISEAGAEIKDISIVEHSDVTYRYIKGGGLKNEEIC